MNSSDHTPFSTRPAPACPTVVKSAKRLLGIAMVVCDLLAHGRPAWAGDGDLHPISERLADAAVDIRLRLPQAGAASVPVVCVYRARRAWDVKTEFRLHWFDSPWRSGSADGFAIEHYPSHEVSQVVPLADDTLAMRVPLRDPDADYAQYQLAEIRLPGVDFGAWSEQAPQLPPAFGLKVSPDALTGKAELAGLTAEPLRNRLPLWPGLRRIELALESNPVPTLVLWDEAAKAHGDGWRWSRRETWDGGRWQSFRRIGEDAVYRAFEWLRSPAASATALAPQALPGVALEVFWPRGEVLTLDNVNFGGDVELLAFPLTGLPERMRGLLATAALPRPGLPAGTFTGEEWHELEAAAAPVDQAAQIRLAAGERPSSALTLRRAAMKQSWLYLFGVPYRRDSRVAFATLVLHPTAWAGPLPKEG